MGPGDASTTAAPTGLVARVGANVLFKGTASTGAAIPAAQLNGGIIGAGNGQVKISVQPTTAAARIGLGNVIGGDTATYRVSI